MPDTADFEATGEGVEFVGAHNFGPVFAGRTPGVAMFPMVGHISANGIPTVTLEAGLSYEVGGASDLAGVIWVSTTRLESLTSEIVLAHEMGHILTGFAHSEIGDWVQVMNILARPGDGMATWDGQTVWQNLTFDNTRHFAPASTSERGSNCLLMRANTDYLTDF